MPLLESSALISLLGVLFAIPPAALIIWKCLPQTYRRLLSGFTTRTENRLHDDSTYPLFFIPPLVIPMFERV